VIQGQILQGIADVLGTNRSTTMRDLRVLDEVDAEYQRLMAEQPWTRREFTVTEFAEQIGATAETVRYMINDNLVKAHKRRGRWYIPVAELERLKHPL